MGKENNLRVKSAVVYLISCILNNKKADKSLISDIPPEDIYRCALNHSLDTIVTAALEDIGITSKNSSEKKMLSIRKALLFDAARKEVISRLEQEGIKYLPLKGVVLKDFYPAVGLRQMADNDILFDSSRRSDVRDIMKSLGYTVEDYAISNQDVYQKPPVLNFEMHISLFTASTPESRYLVDYYSNAFDKALKDADNSFGYSFNDEDFYVYIKAHEFKHYINGGTGLRSLVDTYLYVRAKKQTLDFDYISAECQKMKFEEYEKKSRLLAEKVFSPDIAEKLLRYAPNSKEYPISKTEAELLDEYFHSTYGTKDRQLAKALDPGAKSKKALLCAKIAYLFRATFPPLKSFTCGDPKFEGKWYLYPFFWGKRIFKIIFTRPARTINVIKKIFASKAEQKNEK